MRFRLVIGIEPRAPWNVNKPLAPIILKDVLTAHGIDAVTLPLSQSFHLRTLLWATEADMRCEQQHVFSINAETVHCDRRSWLPFTKAVSIMVMAAYSCADAPIRKQMLDLHDELLAC